MITASYEIADNCIKEMRENERMITPAKNEKDVGKAKTCHMCIEYLSNLTIKLEIVIIEQVPVEELLI